ncbi:MAG: hypothetical protein K6G47_10550 [Clostridia bacterium]|nr:hypothetical protein [Clostridia bacterium]
MNGVKRIAAGVLVVAIGIAAVGCAKAKTRDDLIDAYTDLGAQRWGNTTDPYENGRNFLAEKGEFTAADDEKAQGIYDDLLKGYNGLRDCKVEEASYYVKTSTYDDLKLNTYVITVTFENKEDAELMFEDNCREFEQFNSKESKLLGKYMLVYQDGFNVISGYDLTRESAVYQFGNQVVYIYSLHPSDREDKAVGKICKALDLADPAKAKD